MKENAVSGVASRGDDVGAVEEEEETSTLTSETSLWRLA